MAQFPRVDQLTLRTLRDPPPQASAHSFVFIRGSPLSANRHSISFTVKPEKLLGPLPSGLAACLFALAAHAATDATQILEDVRVKHEFPALAAAVVVDGKIVFTNAVGVR